MDKFGNIVDIEPVAWMPLPEPPKEEAAAAKKKQDEKKEKEI